jgi:hypothetical protein
MLNCSEGELYRLIREGRLESFKDGYIRRITVRSIHRHIANMLEAPDPLRDGVRRHDGSAERAGASSTA